MIKEEDKVFQRIQGNGRDGNVWGDCMKSAIATLFKLKYEDVPHFVEMDDWHGEFRNFLITQGYVWHGEAVNPRCFGCCGDYNAMEDKIKNGDSIDGLYFATVYSPKYYNRMDDLPSRHAVLIDKDFNIVFDPNPEYKDIENYPEHKMIGNNGVFSVDLILKTNK